jgi:hypothetical protein
MLYIEDANGRKRQWHVGDGYPSDLKLYPVVKFQADGHELELFVRAMEAGYVGENSRVGINGVDHGR